jgi:hypothetical protein
MLVLSTNLMIHRCIDLGSIKLSLNKRSGSIKSEFTCCSNSFARALVIGPSLISLDFFAATSSSSIGAGDNGGVIGMSSSSPLRVFCHPQKPKSRGGSEIDTAASAWRKTPEREKLSGRQESTGEIPSRRGEIIAIVITIAPDFIGIIIIIISITSTFISTFTTPSRCNVLS